MPPAKALSRRAFLTSSCSLLLAGCSAPPRETFDLAGSGLPVVTRIRSVRSRTRLAVNEPEAIPPVNSDRIVIRTGPSQVANLAGAQWADRLPRLVQARLIEGFDNTRISAILPGGGADFALASEIRRFEIDIPRSTAVIEIAARLVDDRGNRELAARIFVGEAPALHTTGADAVQALREALESATTQITKWSAANI
jgi:cholesterol transport system auxiliary component